MTTETRYAKRTDVHRPGVIVPDEYEWVCLGTYKDEFGEARRAREDMDTFNAHMASTGGKFCNTARSGGCDVCGQSLIYYHVFYHQPTNAYLHVGNDCTEKLGLDGDPDAFKRYVEQVKAFDHHRAGTRKAKEYLERAGWGLAWEIYDTRQTRKEWREKDEGVIGEGRDGLVAKLIKYGYLTEPQEKLLALILDRIKRRPELEAKRAAERAASAFVGTVGEKLELVVTVVFSKVLPGGQYGPSTLVSMRDDAGNALRWFASGARQHQKQVGSSFDWFDDFERGKRYRLRATVKKHEEYNGERQTMVTRAKMEEIK